MTSLESQNHAQSYLQKAQEYLDSAQDNLDLERATPAAGDAPHAGISAKAKPLVRRAEFLVDLAKELVRHS